MSKNKQETMPMSAVELMVDLQYRNVMSSTRMVAQCDLRRIRSKKERLEKAIKSRDLMFKFLEKQWETGMVPMWIEEAYRLLGDYLHAEVPKLEREENRLVDKIDSLEKELEEYKKKQEKKKLDNGPS